MNFNVLNLLILLPFVFASHDSGFGHVICLEQWNIIKCDLSRGLKCPFALGLDLLQRCHCHIKPSWEGKTTGRGRPSYLSLFSWVQTPSDPSVVCSSMSEPRWDQQYITDITELPNTPPLGRMRKDVAIEVFYFNIDIYGERKRWEDS